ncbi:hypothetical protein CNEO4_1760031 [Clostridium neonatale]|uniref:Uncharacterized protein n=1 Tax=Clostridium neonatale TaxID=137838 RepID=A0AA86MLM8_9CLOT|nr:hypothetical protein CNEO_40176 [Clostridium neonatale]CAG9711933.1 hypothetical protein CNEO_1580014 [Clostridium neonatale]CAG9714223.1 hypothetical protein CNEO_80050 [Clostridium neonatale]CAI3192999.1 hypothetical protein CNEO2_1180004 [Clostridium neonatale]CAI3198567.1 hypothetical protein CNEO2_1670004 [Clostridium neonatale]
MLMLSKSLKDNVFWLLKAINNMIKNGKNHININKIKVIFLIITLSLPFNILQKNLRCICNY